MQLSETVKLYMTKEQKSLITETMAEYINTVNSLVSDAVNGISIAKYTSKNVNAKLPSALINQCIRDAKSIYRKYSKACSKASTANNSYNSKYTKSKEPVVPVLRKPVFYVNNQNFKVNGDYLEFPVIVNGKSRRLSVRTKMTERQKLIFSGSKLGTIRIVWKGSKIVAQIVYEAAEADISGEGNTMGIDLGIKCPAVTYTSDGNVRFYGNGRQNKYMRRKYAVLRRKLQKSKHINAVKRMDNKEQRIMKDIDHKISHDIIETAKAHDVKVIKMERLADIRSTTRTSRKNNHSLHNWSFYRLAQFIEYKARLAGITVEYVNPAYTSQTCPVCGQKHHAKDRNYVCKCGFHVHRDILGAMNICNSTEYVGDSNIRHTA